MRYAVTHGGSVMFDCRCLGTDLRCHVVLGALRLGLAVTFLENLASPCFVEAHQLVEFAPPVEVIPIEAAASFINTVQPHSIHIRI